MSAPNDGGPAFPTENARQVGPTAWHYEGMTLRDWFAGQALAAMPLKDNGQRPASHAFHDFRWAAQAAYQYADAMLAARAANKS